MKRQIFDKTTMTPTVVQPVTLGGTGATTANEACDNLHLISEDSIGASYGVVPLDSNSKVPVQYLPGLNTANGDTIQILIPEVYEGHVVEGVALVTNYDCLRTYDISDDAEDGATIVRQSDIDLGFADAGTPPGLINFQAHLQPGVVNITVNHNTFPITVLQGYIEKPSFIVNGDTQPLIDGIIVTNSVDVTACGSEPNWTPHGYTQTYMSMQLQVATDISFTDIVFNDTVDTSISGNFIDLPALTNNTYYARFKYIGGSLESPWSDTAQFTVYYNIFPNWESSVIYGSGVEPSNATSFGFNVDLSADGLTLAIGSDQIYGLPGQTAYTTGVVHVFSRLSKNLPFSFQKRLLPPVDGFLGYANYGCSVKIANNGNLVFVLCANAIEVSNVFDKSKLFVYKTTTQDDISSLTLLTSVIISHPDTLNNGELSYLAVTPNGSTIAIAQAQQFIPATGEQNNDAQYIKLYDFQNNTLTFVTDIVSYNDNNWTNAVIDIDDSGTRLVIGTPNADANNQQEWRGAVYIYERIAGTWTQTTILNPISTAVKFGASVAISGDGNTLAVGDYSLTRNIYGNSVDGIVYTYEFSELMWSFNELVIEPYPSSSTDQFSPSDIKLSFNGQLMFIGSANSETVTMTPDHSAGLVSIYEKQSFNSNHWTPSVELVGSIIDYAGVRYMGERLAISSDGSTLAASARADDNLIGTVRIFE